MTSPEIAGDGANLAVRPQPVMLSFLGLYLLGRGRAVYSGSVIDVLDRVGVSEEAVRSTLTRMAKRGLLARHPRGRRTYFGLTPHAEAVLEDGRTRIAESGAVNRDWDGTWTLVGFSLPDTRRRERHDLRSQLEWAGFGMLQHGLWIAAGEQDAAAIAERLELTEHVTVFTARGAKPTEAADLVRKAFDTQEIATRYRAFLDRWDPRGEHGRGPAARDRAFLDRRDAGGEHGRGSAARDDLGRQLLLHTDWLQLVRRDPQLPAELLADDWPGIRAEAVFRELDQRIRPEAARIAAQVMDEIPLDE